MRCLSAITASERVVTLPVIIEKGNVARPAVVSQQLGGLCHGAPLADVVHF